MIVSFWFAFSQFSYSQKIQIDGGESPEYYLNIVRLYAPSEDAFIALQYLASPYINKHSWKKAIKFYEDHKFRFPNHTQTIGKIIELLSAPEKGIKIYNMGGNINSLGREYGPVLSPDMKKIYFTGRDREDNIGGEDVFISYYVNYRWTISKPLPSKINTESNEYINSISADGNTLVLFGNYINALGRGDNFYIEKTKNGFSDVIQYPEPINSKWWDADAFLTADGKAVIFSSERPKGVGEYKPKGDYHHGMYWGNTDLYVVLKEADGSWGKTAINLGPTINTPYTERTPFLHPDGKTLYFSSDGHPGLGKSDVFKTVRLSDTSWIEWSEPVNLGKQINTAEEDWGYKISTDGKHAYFSTINEMGFGEEDIYYVELPEEIQPVSDVVTVTGKVIDEKGNPVDATIRWEDVEAMKEVGIAKTDPETGEYFIALPIGKNYAYYADVKGYYSTVNYMDLTAAKAYEEAKVDMSLISVDELKNSGRAIKIENIFFDFGKFDLKPESYEALNLLYKFMTVNDELHVEINAHTDNVGSDNFNQTLSEQRANSVVQYLIQKGINSLRLEPHGYGETMPVADNDTEEGRALNRRVEFRLKK
ncbi:MAG: OmpA family protein [Chlorobi bacterium]|nr:OmpA family protein [Chlorobiota bacterium]MCI0715488.1 OmpA family protein [Chlorobiota bacterium]